MLKDRTKAAKTGHSLLKRKSDAIKIKLHEVLSNIKTVKLAVGEGMQQAGVTHNEAIWAAGSFNHTVIENCTEATVRVKADVFNVAGIKIPKYERAESDLPSANESSLLVGLARGGEAVQECKMAYSHVLENLIKLATLQSALSSLDDALRVTNRRVNALEFVVVPQLENTVRYVISELDELEREDTYRIKKVKDVRAVEQQKAADAEAQLMERLEAMGLGAKSAVYDVDPDEEIGNLFN